MFEFWRIDRTHLSQVARDRLVTGRLDLAFYRGILGQGGLLPTAAAYGRLDEAFEHICDGTDMIGLFRARDYPLPAEGDLFIDRNRGTVFVFTGSAANFMCEHLFQLIFEESMGPWRAAPRWRLRFEMAEHRTPMIRALNTLDPIAYWDRRGVLAGRSELVLERGTVVALFSSLLRELCNERLSGRRVRLSDVVHKMWVRADAGKIGDVPSRPVAA